MLVKLLKSKLHRARITDTKLHYPGSMAIDSELMKAVGLMPYESILVADLDNGSRLETYVVPAEAGSREMVMLGAAANLVKTGDTVIIMSFGFFDEAQSQKHKPKVIALDENNNVVK